MTKTYAVQLKDSDAALLSNLRRYAHELGGIGAPAYLDLLHRIDLALSAPLAESAPEWHSPPLARLYAAELIDAEKLIYRVPRGEILAVFDGSPDDHGTAVGMARLPIAWPNLGEAVSPGWCTVDSLAGGVRLCARPAFPVTALVRPGAAPSADCVPPLATDVVPSREPIVPIDESEEIVARWSAVGRLAELRARVEYAQNAGSAVEGIAQLAEWFRTHPEVMYADLNLPPLPAESPGPDWSALANACAGLVDQLEALRAALVARS